MKFFYEGVSIHHSPYSKEKRPDVSIWFDVDEKKNVSACNFMQVLSQQQSDQREENKMTNSEHMRCDV